MAPSTYQIRFDLSAPFLHGCGIEIGAGINPQSLPPGCECRYYDLREAAEIEKLFGAKVSYRVSNVESIKDDYPQGADFLIAHHVIEHASDPIGLLARFHSYVRDGGTMVVSLPHHELCPDKGRVLPGLDHLVLDHLLARGDGAFESREHIYSFLLGWVEDTPMLKNRSQHETAEFLLSEARRDGHDLHWHAFDTALAVKLVTAVCRLTTCGARLLAVADPYSDPPTTIDILLVYRLVKTAPSVTGFPHDARPDLAQLAERLSHAERRLRNS